MTGARSDVMKIGTLCSTQTFTSCSSRALDACTIWFTATGPTGLPGLAARNAASSSPICVSHSSSNSAGRAFSAGNDPTMPALHCASTSSG